MESCRHHSSLPNRNRVFAFGGENFDVGTDALDFWGANKNHFQWRAFQLVRKESAFADGAVELPPVGVAADADVDGAEAGLLWVFDLSGQQDCSSAGAESGLDPHKFF